MNMAEIVHTARPEYSRLQLETVAGRVRERRVRADSQDSYLRGVHNYTGIGHKITIRLEVARSETSHGQNMTTS